MLRAAALSRILALLNNIYIASTRRQPPAFLAHTKVDKLLLASILALAADNIMLLAGVMFA